MVAGGVMLRSTLTSSIGVDYAWLTALLVNAVQGQHKQIESYKMRFRTYARNVRS